MSIECTALKSGRLSGRAVEQGDKVRLPNSHARALAKAGHVALPKGMAQSPAKARPKEKK